MIELTQDSEQAARKKYDTWRAQKVIIEEHFRSCIKEVGADRTIEELTDALADEITSRP